MHIDLETPQAISVDIDVGLLVVIELFAVLAVGVFIGAYLWGRYRGGR